MKCQDTLNFCQRKRVRLGVGLGLGGETPGRLEVLPKKKGKDWIRGRIRVVTRHVRMSWTFA